MDETTVDFTREPIIETIITPKEGYKLVIRSSKSAGQEEYFVDAVEIVAFGHALFFRSLERPKAFIVPVSDYEVLEVREARMVLKNAGLDRSIKIGGGREGALKASREAEKAEAVSEEAEGEQEEVAPGVEAPVATEARPEVRVDKKRDRRRHYRKRKGREEVKEEAAEPVVPPLEDEKINIQPPEQGAEASTETAPLSPSLLSSLLQPPPTLISETINRYRQNEMFKGAFFLTEEEQYKPHDKVQELLNEEDEEEAPPALQEPTFVPEGEAATSAPETEIEQAKEGEEEEKVSPPEQELVQEIEKEVESSSLPFEKEEENEPEAGLPLYIEEEAEIISEEPPYSTEEDESMKENHSHPNGQTT